MMMCLNCQKEIKGRSDKKYCSDQCRSAHYLLKNESRLNLMKAIHCQLKINRRILNGFNSQGDIIVSKKNLEGIGFNFDHCTQVKFNEEGELIIYCYDRAYLVLNEEEVIILKKSPPITLNKIS